MRVFRLCSARVRANSGEGAKLYGGRWNFPGIPAIYTAESRALCVLERLVHLSILPADETVTTISIPDDLPVTNAGLQDSEADSRAFGSKWLREVSTPVLRVPSSIVPGEYCYLINPEHADFHHVIFGATVPFHYDARLRG